MRRALPILVVLLVACGGEPAAPPVAREPYPPYDFTSLSEIFEPRLRPLGVTFTRGSLVERAPTTYEASPTGNHLALYVEPVGAYSDEDYLEGLVTITRAISPFVFARWSGLESFDVCQEPPPSEDDSAEPLPVTQVTLTRAASEGIDWETFGLADLLRLAAERQADEADFTTRPVLLLAAERVTGLPAYREALVEAGS